MVYIILIISIIGIILGFVALITQKIYINPETSEATEVEIPFIGKIKTNYPALVFAFLGFGLAFYVFNKAYPPLPTVWHWVPGGNRFGLKLIIEREGGELVEPKALKP